MPATAHRTHKANKTPSADRDRKNRADKPAEPLAENNDLAERRQKSEEWARRLVADADFVHLDNRRRLQLAICKMVLDDDRGCGTPFESFLSSLLIHVEFSGGEFPTPDEVQKKLEEFRQDFDDMVRDTPQFLRRYPQYVPPAIEGIQTV